MRKEEVRGYLEAACSGQRSQQVQGPHGRCGLGLICFARNGAAEATELSLAGTVPGAGFNGPVRAHWVQEAGPGRAMFSQPTVRGHGQHVFRAGSRRRQTNRDVVCPAPGCWRPAHRLQAAQGHGHGCQASLSLCPRWAITGLTLLTQHSQSWVICRVACQKREGPGRGALAPKRQSLDRKREGPLALRAAPVSQPVPCGPAEERSPAQGLQPLTGGCVCGCPRAAATQGRAVGG